MGLEVEKGLELFFQNNWKKLSFIIFFLFSLLILISKVQRTFVTLQFVCPMTQELFNLVKEWGKYWKMFCDG
jgi:hypothetical protein